MDKMKEQQIEISATQHMINYLKSQINFFSVMPNRSERMARYYREELTKLTN